MDKNYNKCNVNALDVDIEHVVAKTLQKYINMLMDSRNIINAQREKKRKSLKLAERHFNMEKSNEKINKDLRDAYESYKLGLTDRETYLEQRKVYEQMILQMQENIEKQKVAVGKMAVADVPEVAGFEMLEGEMKLQKTNKEIADVFVVEIVVRDMERVEVKWKFRKEKLVENGRDKAGGVV